MKTITFTPDESSLLQELLQRRLDSIKSDSEESGSTHTSQKNKYVQRHIQTKQSILRRISITSVVELNKAEKLACIGVASEYYDETSKKGLIADEYSWFKINMEEIQILNRLDYAMNVIGKCGYFNDKNVTPRYSKEFRYRHILEVVKKIKESDKIFLSRYAQNNISKITFFYSNKEYLTFELMHTLSLENNRFVPLDENTPEEFASKRHGFLLTKAEARRELSLCRPDFYEQTTLDFMNKVLDS